MERKTVLVTFRADYCDYAMQFVANMCIFAI